MDAVTLARWQFTITTVYHFLFVPLSIGLALVAIFQTGYYRTGDDVYRRMTAFWGKLFLISFAMGVATGIVQEFQFSMFLNLYPRVLVSSLDPAYSLTIFNAASAPYTLAVMSIVAAIFVPIVLAYQGWTYWVFRQRIGRADLAPRPDTVGAPVAVDAARTTHARNGAAVPTGA